MKNLYGNLKMSWLSVILFAVIAGIYTGAVMLINVLDDTSFQDIGISYEWWVIFAVVIVVNCEKNREAMLKCFVFFLISQPLVYATEVLLGDLTLDMAIYYYRGIWLPATILTLPGGFIAYYCKKQNIPGAVIMGLGNTIQAILGVHYVIETAGNFPHHILSAIVCFGSIFLMSFEIQKENIYRLISLLVPLVLTVIALVFMAMTGRAI